jgi:hypothetical protein
MKYYSGFISCLAAAGMAVLLTACGSDSGSSGSGGVSLNITDAPIQNDDIAEVWVRFTHVIIHSDGGDDTPQPVTDGTNDWIDVNLKDLTEGKTQLLGDFELPGGHYSWIRLVINPEESFVYEYDPLPDDPDNLNKTKLDCSSCDESHLKLHRSFDIPNHGGWVNFTIDFDLQKSLTLQLPQSEIPRPHYAYKLRPTLRILDTELASTFIWGTVANPADPTGCSVYIYTGTPTTLDDICVEDLPEVICATADTQRPLTKVDVINNGGTFDYETGPLYPGIYTVAVVCDSDDIDLDADILDYIGVQTVDASLDPPLPSGVEANFSLAPPPAP